MGLTSFFNLFSKKRFFCLLGHLTWAIVFAANSHAVPGQPGTLDATWANASPLGAGKVITPVGTISSLATAIALQPDGKALLAGQCRNGTNDDFCAVRYNADGTLDTTWNGTGTVITPVGTSIDTATAIALQPDGKVLLAGYCRNSTTFDFCALRYNANGTLDTTWNGTGTVITSVSAGVDQAFAIALQPDGKVLLAGYCDGNDNFDFCAVRYNSNGTLDTGWNDTGMVITPVGTGRAAANSLALQPDGKVLLSGVCSGSANDDFCAVRYHANGTLDTSWNLNGTVITPVGTARDFASALALQPDGKVLLAGVCGSTNDDFCAVRYHANGTLDSTWNGTGTVITPVGTASDTASQVVLQPDGKVLLAGNCDGSASLDFCAVRYNGDGTLDLSWNGTGKVITPVGTSFDYANAIALQPDGKVLLAGACVSSANFDFCAVRYDGGPFGFQNCKLDIDGDNVVTATIDSLIHARIALGMTGPSVVSGISFAPHATRTTWPAIREYLITQCGMQIP